MAKQYEDNWDDLARQLGFEPKPTDSEDKASREEDDASSSAKKDEGPAESKIEDFFGASETSEDNEVSEDSTPSAAVTSDKEAGLSDMFVPKIPVDEANESKPRVIDDVTPLDQEPEQVAEIAEPTSGETEEGGVETVEFDVQDLADEDDDRPRRRRKSRRRRRAVIEELREELEREKEEEQVTEVVDSEDSDEKETEETEEAEASEPPPKRERPPRRRRRSRSRRDESDESEDQPEEVSATDSVDDSSDDSDRERDSKNRRRRRRREEGQEQDDDTKVRRKEDGKPERRFPTWEEAIRPVVDANMERTSKPQRRRRPRRNRED